MQRPTYIFNCKNLTGWLCIFLQEIFDYRQDFSNEWERGTKTLAKITVAIFHLVTYVRMTKWEVEDFFHPTPSPTLQSINMHKYVRSVKVLCKAFSLAAP